MTDDDPGRRARLALLSCALAGFATLTDQAVVSYAVPSLTNDLNAATDQVQWFLSVYSLTFGLGLVPGGRWGDAKGRRGLFLAGLGLFLAGAVVSAAAPVIGVAIAGRSVQGFGAGLISAQVLGIIQDLFAGRARVRALAVYSIAASASAVLGPLTAGGLLQIASAGVAWRGMLTISMPFVVATGVLAWRYVPRTAPRGRRVALDTVGILLTGAIVLLATVPVISALPVAGGVAVGVALGILLVSLVLWERRLGSRGGSPLFAPALLRSGGFVSGNVVALLWFGAVGAQGAVITVFLLQDYRLAGLVVAALMIPAALSRIAGSSLSARSSDRYGVWALPGALALEAVTAVVLVPVVGSEPGAWVVVVLVAVQIVAGFASGVFEPLMRARTLSFVSPAEYGLGASFLQLTQRLSATFCIALVTGIAFADGVDQVNPATLRTAVAVSAVLLLVAAAESIRFTRTLHGRERRRVRAPLPGTDQSRPASAAPRHPRS